MGHPRAGHRRYDLSYKIGPTLKYERWGTRKTIVACRLGHGYLARAVVVGVRPSNCRCSSGVKVNI